MKKIFSFIAAAVLCVQFFNFKADAIKVYEEENKFFSQTIFNKNKHYSSTVDAYKDGLIIITLRKQVDCLAKECIGQISFSTNNLSSFEEELFIYSPVFITNGRAKITESYIYNQNNIIYDLYDNSETYGLCETTIKSYYIYVKEPYMNSIIPMDIFGAHIEIPFDTKEYDAEKLLIETEKEFYSLKKEYALLIKERDEILTENNILFKENETLKNNFADINLDGKISIADVVLLMRYVNGQIDTIPFVVS